ncbi:Phosphotyrosine interaction domain (PTB/PID) family protein [Acanthocheilonema viteae]
MDSRDMIRCVNNPDEHSSQHSSDELSSIGGGDCDGDDDDNGSSECDSDADISWSSEAEMNYQQNCYKSSSLLLSQIHDDKNDTLSIDNTGNDDPAVALSLYNNVMMKDDNSNNDSDEEFAVHACLRGLIKSKSITSIQKHAYIDEKILDGNTFIDTSNDKCLADELVNAQTISDDETSASSVPYFSRNRTYHDYPTPIFKTKSNINLIDNWSIPANNFKYGMDFFESDDDLDQARSSPFTCCWSAPEFIADSERHTSDELSTSEDVCFAKGNVTNEKSERVDLSEYDEPMRTSILDFSGPVSGQIINSTRLNILANETCPRAISENDSLCMYDASPSPNREEEEINFVDELPETEGTINKWTPESLINFAKETFCENSEASRGNRNVAPTAVNISKSLGNLDLWETEMGWITRVPSPMDHSGIAMRQSISCHDHMITSYVDCVIQNHYNRCSSPGCRKYASKPEAMKQSILNSGSDTSDDEWIRCADDVALDVHGNDGLHNEIYAQVTVPLFSTSHNNHSNKSLITNNQQHISNLHMDGNKQMKNDIREETMKCKRPTTFLNAFKKVTDDENMVKIRNETDKRNNDKFLSYQEKNQYSILINLLPRRSYSLNMLDQIPEKLIDFEKERYFFITKMIANTDDEHHYADIRDLTNFKEHTIYYPNMNDKNDIEYESNEDFERNENVDNSADDSDIGDSDDIFADKNLPVKRNKLSNFYEFTFDIKSSVRNDMRKLSPSIDGSITSYPVLENKPGNDNDNDNQIIDESHSAITLWDNCCEYAQQINEIAQIWLQKTSETSNVDEKIITDQTAFTIYPKSGDLTKLTVETIELDNRRLPISSPFNGLQPAVNVLPGGLLTHSPSSTVSVHRRLPPLPINSLSTTIITTTTTDIITTITNYTTTTTASFTGHFNPTASSMSTNLFSPSTIVSRPVQSVPKEDHRICFGTESIVDRSLLLFEDSYYEDSNLNDNQLPSKKVLSQFGQEDSSGVSSCCTGLEQFNPTHRVHSSFIPRHDDEVLLEIGDAIHVERECEDHWCYGINLRTNQHGIFPSAHVCEIDLVEEICMGALPSNLNQAMTNERDTFYLTMLASIEVAHHKGNDVLVQAMNKVLSVYKNKEEIIVPQTVLMEVSFRGIHIIDKRRKNFFQCPTFDFFYSLQNISFCGAHPKQLRYFGFITKHPLLPRFACHVFLSNASTQPIVESIGRAFKRSYDEYMAFAHPTEDIYLE